jgi:hypothetical protein
VTNKEAFEKYPFLRERDLEGNIIEPIEADLNEQYFTEIPNGWYKLFFQMCDDLKPVLEKEGILNDFYFLQVKEKFNQLVCYDNGVASLEVEAILDKYRYIASYICVNCGRPAEVETRGYIASFCNDCFKDFVRHEPVGFIKFEPFYIVKSYKDGKWHDRKISFEEEWNRYLNK